MKDPKKTDDLLFECRLIGNPPKKKKISDAKSFIACEKSRAAKESIISLKTKKKQ